MSSLSVAPPGWNRSLRRLGRALATLTLTVGALLLWWVLVCYDLRAWVVVPSLLRYRDFPVDPSVAAEFGVRLPADPVALEAEVKRRLPWAKDFDVWGLPWYVPTAREGLAAGRGDCEAQSFVLASLLAAQGTPYAIRASFSHLWVDYEGRPVVRGETASEALWANDRGRFRIRWPSLPRLRAHVKAQRGLLWDPLHPLRKGLLLVGWPALTIAVPRARRRASVERPTGGGADRRAAHP